MNVASLELSKKLYEAFPEWNDTEKEWVRPSMRALETGREDEPFLVPRSRIEPASMSHSTRSVCPAYDTDFLLDKLPAAITPAVDNKNVAIKDMNTYFLFVQRSPDYYIASYNIIGNSLKFLFMKTADTPEDAACLLAIELFKQGILQRG